MKEQLTEEQKKFLTAEGKVVLKACPGSGKTYSVAHKLLSYIDNWKDYHSGVAYCHLRMWQVMRYKKKHKQFMAVWVN